MIQLFKILIPLLSLILFFAPFELSGQSYLKGSYNKETLMFQGQELVVFTFSRKKNSKGKIKAKYFASNANRQFAKWSKDKKILLFCSGAFSVNWTPGSPPLGLCVDNGEIVNRNINNTMDGLVIVYNGGKQKGGIAVINLDKESITVDNNATYNLRSPSQRGDFLNWAVMKEATVFQTQMMYTKSFGYGFPTHRLNYGRNAERRFLAICKKDNEVYHLVIDYPNSNYLNNAAYSVIEYLKSQSYEIYGLFNLDTGAKNIMAAYDDKGNIIARGPTDVNNATNLLVYYVD